MLESLRLPELAGTVAQYSGLDHPDSCRDPVHFARYPHQISYCYNSRGFRDQEWPRDLDSAVWCLGDSFTTGLGAPAAHTWPQRLAQRTVNISMDGASNNWIARRACDVYSAVQPRTLVIMWSYLHRRERQGSGSDLSRRQLWNQSSMAEDFENLAQCRQQVLDHCVHSRVIELIIPNWQPVLSQSSWSRMCDPAWYASVLDLQLTDHSIISELIDVHGVDGKELQQQIALTQQYFSNTPVISVLQQDLARDGHHFDCVTADWVAAEVLKQLEPD